MKQIPLTAAMAFAALAGGTGTLSAQAFSLEEAYVKGFGGATWPSDLDSTLTEDGTQIALPSFDHDTGYTLGVAVGASVTPNFSMEIEYAYRKADFTVTDRAEGDRADGDTSANAFMFNALYMFDGMGATGTVRPYFGGGIGGANVDVSAGGQDFDTDTVFAYQLIGGCQLRAEPQCEPFRRGTLVPDRVGRFRRSPDGELRRQVRDLRPARRHAL